MPKPAITNVHVDASSGNTSRSIGWTIGEHRYHIWVKTNSKTPTRTPGPGFAEDVIYKNPVNRKAKPNAHTIRLDATIAKNKAMLKAVFAEVEAKGLLAAALKAEADEEQARKDAIKARAAEHVYVCAVLRTKPADPAIARVLALVRDSMNHDKQLTACIDTYIENAKAGTP